MRRQAGPVAYDHPHHDTHGGSTINHNDQHDVPVYDISPGAFISYVNDEPADVTVSDLLDAWYAEPFDGAAFAAVRAEASDDVRKSWARLFWAIEEPEKVHALSPEERAEFDRRTT